MEEKLRVINFRGWSAEETSSVPKVWKCLPVPSWNFWHPFLIKACNRRPQYNIFHSSRLKAKIQNATHNISLINIYFSPTTILLIKRKASKNTIKTCFKKRRQQKLQRRSRNFFFKRKWSTSISKKLSQGISIFLSMLSSRSVSIM